MSNLEAISRLQSRASPEASSRANAFDRDDEMSAMLAEVDLLGLIQSDTGESGRKSGDRYDFKSCPVCGHRDCFSYYRNTNSWTCYGASNTSGYKGGTALEYYKATRRADDTEAVKWLRDVTGHPYEGKQSEAVKGEVSTAQPEPNESGLLLPPWTAIQSTEPPKRNPVLIDGVVRQGHVMLLAGKGKIGKSWAAIELCVSIATGRAEWFGLPLKSSGAVLYIDPELDAKSLDNRFHTVCEAMGADVASVDARISKWCLRGVEGANMAAIIHDLQTQERNQFALVVVDSCSCFVEGDENSSVDVRRFTAKALQIASITGATVVLIHHFSKSRDGDRQAADRARGSSVWLDAPDAVLTITEILPPSGDVSDYLQDGEYACVLESGGIREFPRMEPIRLIFGYPLHRVDADGITDDWKPNSSQRDGAKSANQIKSAKTDAKHAAIASAVLAHFYAEQVGKEGMLIKDAATVAGVDVRTLADALDGNAHLEVVQVTQRKRYVRPKRPPREPPQELPLDGD